MPTPIWIVHILREFVEDNIVRYVQQEEKPSDKQIEEYLKKEEISYEEFKVEQMEFTELPKV